MRQTDNKPWGLPVYTASTLNPSSPSPPGSRCDALHPRGLQLPHLLLERRHLAPAVQRPPVVLPQTPHHLAARRLDGRRQRPADLALPRLEARTQAGNLFADGRRRLALISRERLFGGGQRLLGALELGQLLGLQAAQLVGDAGLDVELEGLGAGDVGL